MSEARGSGTAVLGDRALAQSGVSYSPKLSAGDASTSTCLATQLDNDNNGRPDSTCP
jgi:hypothetical protein